MIPRHLWTNGGKEVLIVKWVNNDGTSYNGFKHPLTVGEVVVASDWNTKTECGGGIHGWPWCFSLGEGKNTDFTATWLVYGVNPNDVVNLGGKVKFRTGIVRYVGDWHGAMMFVLGGQMAWVRQAADGAATASGDGGAAITSGYSGAATASGYNGAATASGCNGAATASGCNGAATASGYSGAATASGYSGAATASGCNGAATASGYNGAATASGCNGAATASGDGGAAITSGYNGAATASGDNGAATASGDNGAATASGDGGAATASGDNGAATASGDNGAATASGYSGAATASGKALSAVVTGVYGKAKAPEFGSIALAWWNKEKERMEMRCSLVGKKKGELKPDTWYHLNEKGHFEEIN